VPCNSDFFALLLIKYGAKTVLEIQLKGRFGNI